MAEVRVASVQRPPQRAHRWGLIENFIVLQYLSTALLLIPGAQSVRLPIRMLPYLVSGALLFFAVGKPLRGRAPATTLLFAAILVLLLNMLRPTTQPIAGLAQLALQVCIAAPLFWAGRAVRGSGHLRDILWIVFIANTVNVAVGILQVFYPDVFLPGEFNRTAMAANPALLESLSYIGANGERIIRPPGLSDLPGGAATAGVICLLFGISGASEAQRRLRVRIFCLAAAVGGLVILYLTQVRSLFLMALIALVAFALLQARQGRKTASLAIAGFGGIVVVASFVMAVGIAGSAVSERFLGIVEEGVLESYSQNRGQFVAQTFSDLFDRYPFGAGVGRWGVMHLYFADRNLISAQEIYVEIQVTGWLLDGGIFMWLFYGGAVATSLYYAFRLASRRAGGDIAFLASLVFCAQLLIAGTAMAGPVFNTQFGVQFWTLAAMLHAAVARDNWAARSAVALRRANEVKRLAASPQHA